MPRLRWLAFQHTSVSNAVKLKRSVGGYHDYEGVRPPFLDEKLYCCNYLQYVDTFVYFSHKLICIPPPTWTNTMHRNGVKVLGTFVLESEKIQIERMFEHSRGEYVVAKQLADMADAYGFDGWLLNVETELPQAMGILQLNRFIEQLRVSLGPERKAVWYDALTIDNQVDYQNSLTEKNFPFALAAGSFFTNYKWTEKELGKARSTAERNRFDMTKVHFGIDVWAQNTNMPGPPRVTYPPKGGGGTNTGLVSYAYYDFGGETNLRMN